MSDGFITPSTDAEAEPAADLIRSAGSIVAITHVGPDADAIGSLLGLTLALRSIGKNVTPACSDEVSRRFYILPGARDIVHELTAPPDLLIALDCGDRERMGKLVGAPEWLNVPILNLDHHVTNTHFGRVNWIDIQATATSEIALRLIDHLHISLTTDVATNLLYGIVGDTLGFRTPHTTPKSMECAMRLMSAGANLSEIMEHQFNRRSFGMVCLWSKALDAMRLEPVAGPDHARVIWTQISQDARRACGQPDWSNNGLSSFLAGIDEVDISAVIVEKDDNEIDVSMRARPGFDVSGAARSLGGGGHRLAAGATMNGPLSAAIDRVVPAFTALRRSDERR